MMILLKQEFIGLVSNKYPVERGKDMDRSEIKVSAYFWKSNTILNLPF